MTDLIAVRRDNRFSQIPHWVNESQISDGAYRLYSYLFKYSDNNTREAYPSRATLAKDIRKTDRSVDTYIKELEAIGAVRVLRRKKRGTKQNYTNIYHVITANPYAEAELEAFAPEKDWEVIPEVAKPASLGGEADFAGTNTHLTMTHSSVTSDQRSDDKRTFTPEKDSGAATPSGISEAQRKPLREALVRVGLLLKAGFKFYDDEPQEAWDDFTALMEDAFPDDYQDCFAHLLENGKWTVSANVASPYAAGRELTTIINTGFKG